MYFELILYLIFQLLPRLHEVLQRRDENNPVELKLHDMANEIHKVVTVYLQVYTPFINIFIPMSLDCEHRYEHTKYRYICIRIACDTKLINNLQDSLDAMLKCANEQCPTILSQTVIRGDESEPIAIEDDLRNTCKEKNQINNEFIHTTITEQAGADIINRVK